MRARRVLPHLPSSTLVPVALLALAAFGPAACKEASTENRCLSAPGLVPGLGVRTARGSACLGARARTLEATFGAPSRTEDLAALGTRRHHPVDHLILRYDGPGPDARLVAVEVLPGVAETTPEGVGLGSSPTAVRAALGEPDRDPFLGAWWYAGRGLTVIFAADEVSRLVIAAPAP